MVLADACSKHGARKRPDVSCAKCCKPLTAVKRKYRHFDLSAGSLFLAPPGMQLMPTLRVTQPYTRPKWQWLRLMFKHRKTNWLESETNTLTFKDCYQPWTCCLPIFKALALLLPSHCERERKKTKTSTSTYNVRQQCISVPGVPLGSVLVWQMAGEV